MVVEPTELVRIFYNAFNTGDLNSLDRAFSPNWVDHTLPAGRPPGLVGIKAATEILRNALPDLHCEIEDLLFVEDKAIARITFSGTDRGGFMGAPPTNRHVEFIAFDIHRIDNGQIVESWHLEDNLSFLLQLGIVSLPA